MQKSFQRRLHRRCSRSRNRREIQSRCSGLGREQRFCRLRRSRSRNVARSPGAASSSPPESKFSLRPLQTTSRERAALRKDLGNVRPSDVFCITPSNYYLSQQPLSVEASETLPGSTHFVPLFEAPILARFCFRNPLFYDVSEASQMRLREQLRPLMRRPQISFVLRGSWLIGCGTLHFRSVSDEAGLQRPRMKNL